MSHKLFVEDTEPVTVINRAWTSRLVELPDAKNKTSGVKGEKILWNLLNTNASSKSQIRTGLN